MVILFWLITFLLLGCAFLFVLPGLRNWRIRILVAMIIAGVIYGLYFQWGNSQRLKVYYSKEDQVLREQQIAFRPMLTEFKKEEFRLRLRLEENPNDNDAEWRLLDLLAIKAITNKEHKLAERYWQAALKKIPEDVEHRAIKHRIKEILTHLPKKD